MRAINIPDSFKQGGFKPAIFTNGNNPVLILPIAPQGIQFSRETEYNSMTPLGSIKTYHHRVRGGDTGVQFSDIPVQSGCKDVSPIRSAVDTLVARGTVLTFSQGSRIINNLIVRSYDWTELDWAYGFPTRARMSLSCLIQSALTAPAIRDVGKNLTTAEIDRAKKSAESAGFKTVKVDKVTGSVFSGDRLIGSVIAGNFTRL